ncbi:septum site-determining protein Ssd [Actinomadura kijaniata]|uniref:septum site-determining protein Ssd n=1 Tax=Actinomadura kijaniata TaxID=46161 RepID=UPI000836603D|nr:septum site-determining protein Ssd [Actinomadura kijaniata]
MTCAATIVTGDAGLADDLLRLAAAAAARADVAHRAAQARTAWHRCPLILVGADLAEAVAAERLPRRSGIVLVTRADDLDDAYRRALRVGAQDLAVLPDEEDWLIEALAAAADPTAARATTVCVRGARGGVGTSVLAAALALTAAETGRRTLLVDGDPHGGGIDLLLGLEDTEGARWPDLATRRGRLSPAILREALPRRGDLSVLSWRDTGVPVQPEAVHAVLGAATRAFALVVVDVPKHPGDIGSAALALAEVGLLLVPTEIRATLAAATLRGAPADLRLVTTGPSPGGLTPELVAQSLDLPLAGALERDRRASRAAEDGDLSRILRRGPLSTLCAHLLTSLTRTPARQAA